MEDTIFPHPFFSKVPSEILSHILSFLFEWDLPKKVPPKSQHWLKARLTCLLWRDKIGKIVDERAKKVTLPGFIVWSALSPWMVLTVVYEAFTVRAGDGGKYANLRLANSRDYSDVYGSPRTDSNTLIMINTIRKVEECLHAYQDIDTWV